MRVFLGGTCNGSLWRNELIPMLEAQGIDYFNPVVDDWNEEAQQRKIQEREECDICLYCITPKMPGGYSIAEVVDDSNKRPEKTVFVVLDWVYDDHASLIPPDGGSGIVEFDEGQKRSLEQVGRMVGGNGGKYCDSLLSASEYIGRIADASICASCGGVVI